MTSYGFILEDSFLGMGVNFVSPVRFQFYLVLYHLVDIYSQTTQINAFVSRKYNCTVFSKPKYKVSQIKA